MIRSFIVIFMALFVQVSAFAVVNDDPGAPETNQVLPALYVQNVFLKFMLASYGKSDAEKIQAVKDAEAVIQRFAFQDRYIQQVTSEADYRALKASYFPESISVADEIAHLKSDEPPPYLLLNPVDSDAVDAIEREGAVFRERFEELGRMIDVALDAAKSMPVRKLLLTVLNHPELSRRKFSEIPDTARLQTANLVHQELSRVLSQIDTIGDRINDSGALKMSRRSQERFFQLVLGLYFRKLPLENKINIIGAFFDHPEAKTLHERFELMIMNAGPQFQKMLQAFAREAGLSVELKTDLKKVEQSTRALPWRLVQNEILSQNVDFEWVEIQERAVAAGTVAQVHKARIRLKDGTLQTVAVRVLKPGIRDRIQSDTIALAEIARIVDADPILIEENFPKLTPFLNDVEEMVRRELNVRDTVTANEKGTFIYKARIKTKDGRIAIEVPHMQTFGENSTVSVQDWIDGVSFEEFASTHVNLAQAVIRELSRIWLSEVLFGGGFYHADLHQGNLRVRWKDNAPVLDILDFGMAGELDSDLQTKFLAFGALTEIRDAELLSRIVWELSTTEQNTISREGLRSVFIKELARQAKKGIQSWPFFEWAALAVNSGVRFPPELTSLNRGAFFVFRMLEDNGLDQELPRMIRDLALQNPLRVAKMIATTPTISKTEWMKALYDQTRSTRDQISSRAAKIFAPLRFLSPSPELVCRSAYGL